MSKEESERASAERKTSSVPPRLASEPPRAVPSTPPSTDEIDTDWGAEQEPPQAAAAPSVDQDAIPTPRASTPSVSPPGLSGSAAPGSPSAAPPKSSSPSAAPAAPALAERSPTLVGIAPVTPTPPESASTDLDASSHSAPPEPLLAAEVGPPLGAERTPAEPGAALAAKADSTLLPPEPTESTADTSQARRAATSTPPAGASLRPSVPPRVSGAPPRAQPSSTSPLAAPLTTARQVSAAPPAQTSAPGGANGFGRWLLVLGAGVVVVALVGYRVLHTDAPLPLVPNTPPVAVAVTPTAEPKAAPPATPTVEPAPLVVPAPGAGLGQAPTEAASEAALASASPPEPVPPSAAEPAASGEPTPNPSASGTPASGASASGKRSILIKSIPPKARFFHFGKQVGVAPFVLQLDPGEHHSYEAGLPGYVTRKVFIDGSEPEITVGLRSEKR